MSLKYFIFIPLTEMPSFVQMLSQVTIFLSVSKI